MDILLMLDNHGYTNEANRLTWCSAYLLGYTKPNYPVPAMIGPVVAVIDDYAFELIVTDCDEAADPRLCISVSRIDGFTYQDYPHNSPNYR